jgi:REP element-mobilizing transposase RayT
MPRSVTLRTGRWSEPGRAYLVTTVTHERRPVFQSVAAGRRLVQVLMRAQSEGEADTLAYVVMPDHLHWLLVLGDQRDLSTVVGGVKGAASRSLGGRWHAGQLWQPGFHDHAVRSDEDLRRLARYLVANPLRAGLVSSLSLYPLWDAVWVGDGHRG